MGGDRRRARAYAGHHRPRVGMTSYGVVSRGMYIKVNGSGALLVVERDLAVPT